MADVVEELRGWLDANWDPDITVAEWWERLGMAGWSAPSLPAESYGRGASRTDAVRVAETIAAHGALAAPGGLGLLLAASAISLTGQLDPSQLGGGLMPLVLPLVLPLAILALPFLDLTMAFIRRTYAGRWWFLPDKQHLHHRLLERGHSQRRAVLLMYIWSALVSFGVIVLGLVRTDRQWQVVAVVLIIAVVLLLAPLDERLARHAHLLRDTASLADMALLPFVGKFAAVDAAWFDAAPLPRLRSWLQRLTATPLFTSVMDKYPAWQPGDSEPVFGSAAVTLRIRKSPRPYIERSGRISMPRNNADCSSARSRASADSKSSRTTSTGARPSTSTSTCWSRTRVTNQCVPFASCSTEKRTFPPRAYSCALRASSDTAVAKRVCSCTSKPSRPA